MPRWSEKVCWTTTTPAGKAMFQMMGVFAEFERAMIRERVNAGIARAKADGKHCGRPFIDTKLEGRIRDALATPGRPGLHKIAKQFGVGSGTVQRIAAAESPKSPQRGAQSHGGASYVHQQGDSSGLPRG
jgi:DNA invertase Pin-like site-specific DNA recombinase